MNSPHRSKNGIETTQCVPSLVEHLSPGINNAYVQRPIANMPNTSAPQSIWVDLMGATVHTVEGVRYRTRVIEAGAGESLILIHGVGSSAEIFARNIMNLAQHFHVYAIDALYHGYSSLEPYDSEYRVERQAEAVIDFMEKNNFKTRSLDRSEGVGYSGTEIRSISDNKNP